MRKNRIFAVLIALTSVSGFPESALAGWKFVPAGQPQAIGPLTFSPSSDWNRSTAMPGKQGATWTRDGFELNRLDVFSGVPTGQPLFKERSKKQNPMPKFDKSMLLPDLVDFFERSFRVQYRVSAFAIDESAPQKLSGHTAMLVRYHYSLPNDELNRQGEAIIAVKSGSLFVMNFQAPSMYYFGAGVDEFREIVGHAHIN